MPVVARDSRDSRNDQGGEGEPVVSTVPPPDLSMNKRLMEVVSAEDGYEKAYQEIRGEQTACLKTLINGYCNLLNQQDSQAIATSMVVTLRAHREHLVVKGLLAEARSDTAQG